MHSNIIYTGAGTPSLLCCQVAYHILRIVQMVNIDSRCQRCIPPSIVAELVQIVFSAIVGSCQEALSIGLHGVQIIKTGLLQGLDIILALPAKNNPLYKVKIWRCLSGVVVVSGRHKRCILQAVATALLFIVGIVKVREAQHVTKLVAECAYTCHCCADTSLQLRCAGIMAQQFA